MVLQHKHAFSFYRTGVIYNDILAFYCHHNSKPNQTNIKTTNDSSMSHRKRFRSFKKKTTTVRHALHEEFHRNS